MPCKDIDERKAYAKAYYQAHKAESITRSSAYNQAHPERYKAWKLANRDRLNQKRKEDQQAQKAFVRLQKVGKVCVDCQKSDIDKLCYHHTNPATKCFTVSTNTLRSQQTILEEIAKCVLLCRKCHCKRHNPYLLAYSKTTRFSR